MRSFKTVVAFGVTSFGAWKATTAFTLPPTTARQLHNGPATFVPRTVGVTRPSAAHVSFRPGSAIASSATADDDEKPTSMETFQKYARVFCNLFPVWTGTLKKDHELLFVMNSGEINI
jgi:hypothetical protein